MADEHDHDHDDERDDEPGAEEGEDDDAIVLLEDAEGNVVEYLFLDVVELDGDSFALLTPVDEDEESESTEIFIMRYEVDEEGGESFGDLDDEELFRRVQEVAEKRFAEWQASEAD